MTEILGPKLNFALASFLFRPQGLPASPGQSSLLFSPSQPSAHVLTSALHSPLGAQGGLTARVGQATQERKAVCSALSSSFINMQKDAN